MAGKKTRSSSWQILMVVAVLGLLGAFRPLISKLIPSGESTSTSAASAGSDSPAGNRQVHGEAAESTPETSDPLTAGRSDGDDIELEFRICTACAFKGQYQRDKEALEAAFPSLQLHTVRMTEFDVGVVKRTAAQVAQVSSYVMMAASFAGPTVVSALGMGPEHPAAQACNWLQENRMYGIGIYFALGQLSSYLAQSGAYEVYVNGELVHSRKATGGMPTMATLGEALAKRGLVPTPEFAMEHGLEVDGFPAEGTPDVLQHEENGIDEEFA